MTTDQRHAARGSRTRLRDHAELLNAGAAGLERDDPALLAALNAEIVHQDARLPLVAYASLADPSVLAAAGSALANVTAEGYPGARYHPGADHFDTVERLAVERARHAFSAEYANVQPHSCSSANLAVMFGLLDPGDTVLGLELSSGGHLTHGSSASVSGRYLTPVRYGVTDDGWIDYDQVADLAERHRPRMIIAGASAYPRTIDYPRMRAIADAVGAYLLADMSHIAGLVAGGWHPSPVDIADITTTSTYKQLGGPRGGLILLGHRGASLAGAIQRAVFPRFQGTPSAAAIAAKARALDLVARPSFAEYAKRVADDARALAESLVRRGFHVLTGGTDTHLVLVNTLAGHRLTGAVAEMALGRAGILANRNQVPADTKPPSVTSGLRIGTNIVAQRGFVPAEMDRCAAAIAETLGAVRPRGDLEFSVEEKTIDRVRHAVDELVRAHPFAPYRTAVPA